MDELRELALQAFQQRTFSPVKGIVGYHFLQLSADGHDYILYESLISEDDLPNILKHANNIHPSITFFQIRTDRAQSIQITRAGFLHLATLMGLDPQVLYLIAHDYDGYHHLGEADNTATDFLGTSRFSLIWNRRPQSQSTVALVLVRRDSPFPELLHLANTYRNHLANPHILPFLAIVYIVRVFDRSVAQDLEKIHYVEARTGYGPNNPVSPSTRFNIHDISNWLKEIGALQAYFANKHRQLDIVRQIIPSIAQGNIQNHQDPLCMALPTIEDIARTLNGYITYLEERSKTLVSILFALLTHEDAAASADLAEASKRDSSAMKAITILTMAFLPATFFATLFALPTLQWNQDRIIQRRFWVYWAFTIPATAMVFGLWGGMLKTRRVWRWLGQRWAQHQTRDEKRV
ncbi:hypothetical protein BO94DRAFT_615719 [Aspergillus sclerotioniger CBS 115572]|uniref:Uncharacterized protein n=1 Tax=Aspergillus sclerotioniger CBS 115572 TaxID=1450535 RepID=A0A317X7Y8_9EURO|nr:hypothetical protein BO94DRAFT_615719 [Aspergillus sclerotioniger CBS 115572]PWY93018.1 hypothetical protein BO94DRAFT_615719 [Aspergillus sclerotioniger CBS 115572]